MRAREEMHQAYVEAFDYSSEGDEPALREVPEGIRLPILDGRCWDRTSDLCRVKAAKLFRMPPNL
jgi:hypothetical protein